MDLDSRVDRMDEELKLLKNEIKQVLLEVQERVLSAENPFAMTVNTDKPAAQNADGPLNPDSIEAPMLTEAVPEPSQQRAAQPQAAQPQAAQPQQGPEPVPQPQQAAPATPQPASPQGPPQQFAGSFPAPGFPPAAGPPVQMGAGSVQEFRTSSASPPASDAALNGKADAASEEEVQRPIPGKPQSADDNAARDDDRSAAVERSEVDADERVEPKLPQPTTEEETPDPVTREAPMTEASTGSNSSAEDRRDLKAPTPPETQRNAMDFVTIAGLAQWADRAVKRVGQEYVADLLEIGEQTGRLDSEVKETLLSLTKLLAHNEGGPAVSAKEMVLMLTQLDSMLGIAPSGDQRLLSILLHDDAEALSSTRP